MLHRGRSGVGVRRDVAQRPQWSRSQARCCTEAAVEQSQARCGTEAAVEQESGAMLHRGRSGAGVKDYGGLQCFIFFGYLFKSVVKQTPRQGLQSIL
ncbi:hypothetical protein NDU88_006782 [Pleurodeles waltl]|uniref:Uncharacterized protein n=1 Tax=Pleurodeles waltl TaxID=8319 RepID=A0AAV7VNL5_PLEWA|nr:hypothetical protein NDU88_006782 [Pleurodeles waltl]